jgi:hypothetical protein
VRKVVLLGAAVAALFVALMLWTTQGHFVAQVSDLYVVAQYARAMAEGHPFRYNPGEAPTTGSTSLLHTALLALGHALGARGEGLVALAVLLGAGLYLASIPLAARAASRLGTRGDGLLAGALVALSGPVVWSYLYGSDIALFLFLALLLLDRWLAFGAGGPAGGLAVAAALLALARPEGLLIGLGLGTASLLARQRTGRRLERLLPWTGAAAGVLVLFLQRVMTGSWLGTSVSEKALLPSYGPVETLAVASKYGVDVVRGLLLGFYPAESPVGFSQGQAAFAFPPLGLLFVMLTAVTAPLAVRGAARAWLVVVALAFALAGPNVFMGVHFNRYLIWAFPGLVAFAAAGLGAAARLLARNDEALERALFRTFALLFLLLGALSTARFAAVYAEMAGETWRREIPMADFVRRSLPRGVAIANAATSIEYLTGHRNVNLHGVTSPPFLGGKPLDREANLLESVARLPADERPAYLLLTRSGLEGSELMQAFADGPPLFETASLGDDLLLLRARWDVADAGRDPLTETALAAVRSLERVDALNVGDPRDEADHGYRVASRMGEVLLGAAVAIGDIASPGGSSVRVADAGRLVVGSETFRVRTHAGRDLVVVLRAHSPAAVRTLRSQGGSVSSLAVGEAGFVVRVDGRETARVRLANAEGWNEHVFRVPAEALRVDGTTLSLSGRYAAHRYWFYQ